MGRHLVIRKTYRQSKLNEYPWAKEVFAPFSSEETPYLVLDIDRVEKNYRIIEQFLPKTGKIHYAVKANPSVPVLERLYELGSHFDAASIYEIDKIMSIGIPSTCIHYGSTVKKEREIARAHACGVTLFTCDSEIELLKQARAAPGSKVFFRLMTSGSGADWPLSGKFGNHPEILSSLIGKAREMGLEPYGLSFHVGSQQRDISQWDDAIARCRHLFDLARQKGIELRALNIGGGLPAPYQVDTPPLSHYLDSISGYLRKHFDRDLPEIFIEPGRALVAEAGVIVSEVILLTRKSPSDPHQWVYLDVGFSEASSKRLTNPSSIRFSPIEKVRRRCPSSPVPPVMASIFCIKNTSTPCPVLLKQETKSISIPPAPIPSLAARWNSTASLL